MNGFGNFIQEMTSIRKDLEHLFEPSKLEQPNNSQDKSSNSIPLSKDEMKAFIGLCSFEGIPAKEKIAELIKDYIEEKRTQMKK